MSMANVKRGEAAAILDGKPHTLCLTLGALAELETALGGEDILAIARRFEAGRITAREAIAVIGAGLRGAGHDISDKDVERMQVENGVPGYLSLVVRLLQAAFGIDETDVARGDHIRAGEDNAPFPGGA